MNDYNDTIDSGFENDILRGGLGDDSLAGDRGNDYLTGGFGDDTLDGVNKVRVFNDRVEEKAYIDTLVGGAGEDRFILGQSNGSYYNDFRGRDYAYIADFNLDDDTLQLHGQSDYLVFSAPDSNSGIFEKINGGYELIAVLNGNFDNSILDTNADYV